MNYEIATTALFDRWREKLRDKQGLSAIYNRLRQVRAGNFGSSRSVGGRVSEFKINVGSGYRLYYTIKNQTVVLLLCGGDKGSQQKDIDQAKALVRQMED